MAALATDAAVWLLVMFVGPIAKGLEAYCARGRTK